jgi:hypothetical protein
MKKIIRNCRVEDLIEVLQELDPTLKVFVQDYYKDSNNIHIDIDVNGNVCIEGITN